MNFTYSLVDIADRIVEILEDNKLDLDLEEVYFGNQNLVPRTPAIMVDPNEIVRTLRQTGHVTENIMEIEMMYFYASNKGNEVNTREALLGAEAVADLLNSHPKLTTTDGNDLVINGYVTRISSGFVTRRNTIYTAARLLWNGQSRTRLLKEA